MNTQSFSFEFALKPVDFPAYRVCSGLYLKHLMQISAKQASPYTGIRKLALRALLLIIVFVVAVNVFTGLFRAGYTFDPLSKNNLPIYLLVLAIGAASFLQQFLQSRSVQKQLFAGYASSGFDITLETGGFRVITKRMDARFSWGSKTCRCVRWKDYMFILHPNTMVLLPERALPVAINTVMTAIEHWQSNENEMER